MKKLLMISVTFFSLQVMAKDCQAINFPFDKNQDRKQIANILVNSQRHDVESYLFYEVTKYPNSKLSPVILDFLITTEKDKNTRGFYKTIEWASKDEKGNPRLLSLSDICSLYQKTK